MSVELTTQTSPETETTMEPEWNPPTPPTDLIFDDGEPLESNRHRIAMNVLIRSLQQAWSERNDFYTGGNMFVYYSDQEVFNKDFRGPDFFAVLDVDGTKERQGWVVWQEEGRYPDVIVELMSPSTSKVDTGKKKNIYGRIFRTPDYFVYDPFKPKSLQGWHLDISKGYQSLVADDRGWLWCESLGFWLGTWSGTIDREEAVWLRFYDTEGNLVLLPEEAERQKAEAVQQRFDEAQQRFDEAQQQLDEAQQQLDEAQQRAETERQRAETERQRAERMAEQLRAMGLDPDQL
ncbi:Uma2 family endonuclease [Roseofilum sp. BLCC_M154]|uniref:Uma2 family endonuclease n=1 Tax=Roseofilum acuticapitatum BLCC-M154 TaxID=3022444 RepID=A0ABT7AQU7_9CYAN|nr:Uma2 family endonuclease [Roseofilum acuticapitatum]MDJ1169269.1 Uma2 family endonuclease [Roseofilum acuticapitatum BLCC-M154]